MDQLNIEDAIRRGIEYLKQYQYPNGQFRAFTATDDEMHINCTPDSSVFSTALICYSLGFLAKNAFVNEMISLSTGFLLREMKGPGAWKHYTQLHGYHSIIPADLDDTCCVSYILEKNGIKWIRGKNINLITSNRNKEGLFYTWLSFRLKQKHNRDYIRLVRSELLQPVSTYFFWRQMECERNDIDAAVNANVLFYLGHNKTTAPIVGYLNNIIKENKEDDCDKWYRNPFSIYYFIARNYKAGISDLEPSRKLIIDKILSATLPNGMFGSSVLDTALAICALADLNAPITIYTNQIKLLLDTQSEAGCWQRRILYYGGPKKLIGWGSEELTTAFCLEALQKFQNQVEVEV
ncbi:hypothetical protein [Flavisolibacter tropicus]|uniref:Uncharacterized protein n=1 Tax=Flavisolibacter tropicus TaxID=1492898 RepID=A0A172U1G0_9BACT|nr:hypothetical protein [Flavisolibacter tropicus]ANE53062.1 hypothetical protein SY85_23885 [Flavisolibacter tropicus]